MSLGRLRSGELLAGASALGLLVVTFIAWFAGESAWETLPVIRLFLLATIAMALVLVVLTATENPIALPVAAGVITAGVAIVTWVLVFYRVVVNEPGTNAIVELDSGAYLGLLLVSLVAAGAWRTMQDERTGSERSRRQTERVLAVRGTPRPPPPERDPDRPAQGEADAPPA